ncbi:MAG: protein kinase, partial [Chloroflexota bacterium]
RLGRAVAMKFLKPASAHDTLLREDFQREARAVSQLDHPNILTVHDIGEQDGAAYMVTPFMAGGTLYARMSGRTLPLTEALAILEPLAAALDYAHGQRFVHRDVKPANVLFSEHGRLVLSDFGLARVMESETFVRLSGQVAGTPAYMSPEQALGQRLGPASDRYSLGVIAYELLTGRPPFAQTNVHALINAHISLPPVPPRSVNPALPAGIEAALLKMLAKESQGRFRSGQEFVTVLSDVPATPPTVEPPGLALGPGPTLPAPPHSGPPRTVRSRRAVMLGLGAAVLAATGLSVLVRIPLNGGDFPTAPLGPASTLPSPIQAAVSSPPDMAAVPTSQPTLPPAGAIVLPATQTVGTSVPIPKTPSLTPTVIDSPSPVFPAPTATFTTPETTTASSKPIYKAPPSLIQVEQSTNPARRGEQATVRIVTRPGVECSLEPLVFGPEDRPRIEPTIANSVGTCSWTWTVPADVIPGAWRYRILVREGENLVTWEIPLMIN